MAFSWLIKLEATQGLSRTPGWWLQTRCIGSQEAYMIWSNTETINVGGQGCHNFLPGTKASNSFPFL